tara:strand:- start:1944 stop:2402 length:459 start_codon:yes stop_codon:yes gene_type:complete
MWEVLMGIVSGGATGILGSLFGRVAGIFEAVEKRKNMKLEFDQEFKMQTLNIQAHDRELESEERIISNQTASSMRQASYGHDTGYGKPSKWVINILRLVRPTLTVMLLGLTAWIFGTVVENGLKINVINQVLFMTSMALSWWWGDRAPSSGK